MINLDETVVIDLDETVEDFSLDFDSFFNMQDNIGRRNKIAAIKKGARQICVSTTNAI